jgi:hypothetical protein
MADDRSPLCGATTGRATRPEESVNCPMCRVILNHVRQVYPSHAEYTDWRLTAKQRREAAESMYRDLVLGEVND